MEGDAGRVSSGVSYAETDPGACPTQAWRLSDLRLTAVRQKQDRRPATVRPCKTRPKFHTLLRLNGLMKAKTAPAPPFATRREPPATLPSAGKARFHTPEGHFQHFQNPVDPNPFPEVAATPSNDAPQDGKPGSMISERLQDYSCISFKSWKAAKARA